MPLYDEPVGALDPRSMALMQMGMGLMRGPSNMPISLGQSLGQAGMQGMQAYQQAQQSNQQQQMFAMKMAEAKRQEEERAKREAGQAALLQNPEMAKFAPFIQAGLPITSVMDHVMPKPTEKKPVVVAPGASLVDPTNPEKPLYTAPDRTKDDELSRVLKAAGVAEGSPQWIAAHNARLQKLTTHAPAPSATNIIKQESEFGKKVGGELGEMYSGLLKADMNAPATIGKYERLNSLLKQVNTGKFTGTTVDLKAAAKGLGVDLNSLGVADNVAPAQAAKALSNQLALELRNPAGGAGMPGAMSDQDRNFLVQMIPNLENDPKGNEKMMEYRIKLARREQQVARMARDYRKKNGKFDEGFFDDLQKWSDTNPLFPQAATAVPKPGAGWSIRPKGE